MGRWKVRKEMAEFDNEKDAEEHKKYLEKYNSEYKFTVYEVI